MRCIAAVRSTLPPPITRDADRMIEAADAARPRADAQVGAEGEREKAARQFGGGESRVLRLARPANAPGGAGCLPEAANAAVAIEIRIRNAANDRFIVAIQVSRRWRTRPSCATEATSVPSRVNISPRAKPREPCRLGESCA